MATTATAAAAAATTATWSDSSTLLTDSEDETPLVEIGRRLRMSRISASQRDSRDKRVSFNARESDTLNRASPSPTTVQMPAHKSRKPVQSALKKTNSCIQLSGKSASVVSTLRLASKSMSVSASIPAVYKSSLDPLDHVPIAMLASSGSMQQRSLSAQPASRAVEEPCAIVDDIMRASSVSSVLPFTPPRHVAVMSDTPARSFSISRMSPSIEASPELGSSLKQRSLSFMSLRKPFSKASVKGIANRVTDTCCTNSDFAVGTGITKLAADEPKHVQQRSSISVERSAISNRSLSMPTVSKSLPVKKRWNWVWARKECFFIRSKQVVTRAGAEGRVSGRDQGSDGALEASVS
ncbi:hypothetical protein BJ741DRAFT_584233 [Chytriomyces cf. hyalinus JEL632]|nr:hypothetical protein BJ741DRAFT_584233 [Chytriomyces cf. hyalinus JEL632]